MSENIKLYLKILAPYLAVVIFWCIFKNAWLTIIVYHAQIVFWSKKSLFRLRMPDRTSIIFAALPVVITGPLLYFILPFIIHTELAVWLTNYHFSRVSFIMMIPYFGLLHPFLEQIHWAPLRERTPATHPMFAGYHILVLYSLLTVPWLVVCFVILTTASLMWQKIMKKSNSLVVPVLSHVIADLGIIVAALLRI
jgi:hypothetical protein